MGGWEPVTEFTDRLFGHLRRTEQRRWANVYLQGLLGTSGKKSIRRLAAAASESPTAAQALHQFINESPWDWAPACDQLTQWIQARTRPTAWTVSPVVLPKRGELSCGVHRRFVPHTGRTVNCQVGTAVFMSTDLGEIPVRWSLLLPEQWSQGPHMERARIPRTVLTSPENHVLHLADQVARCSVTGDLPVVVDLDGYMDTSRLIRGLNQRGQDFVVAVPDSFPLVPCTQPRRQAVPAARILNERRADFPSLPGRVPAPAPGGLVLMPGATAGRRPQPFRLFVGSDAHRADSGRMWITNMVRRPVDELLEYTGRQAATSATISLLDRDFGLRDFEGRSFPGWHHHMTLLSAAFAYSRLAGEEPLVPAPTPPGAVRGGVGERQPELPVSPRPSEAVQGHPLGRRRLVRQLSR